MSKKYYQMCVTVLPSDTLGIPGSARGNILKGSKGHWLCLAGLEEIEHGCRGLPPPRTPQLFFLSYLLFWSPPARPGLAAEKIELKKLETLQLNQIWNWDHSLLSYLYLSSFTYNISKYWFCTRISNFFQSPIFSIPRRALAMRVRRARGCMKLILRANLIYFLISKVEKTEI